ncbi:hypothetical protein [Neobacillus mesonae]|uniref:hypothetical protein n=1 Tax=Neobacillus mesonae TaxID=1193713 RepID=UPI002E230C80|nr:hypothetical protein [Neobacillus mesonae]
MSKLEREVSHINENDCGCSGSGVRANLPHLIQATEDPVTCGNGKVGHGHKGSWKSPASCVGR